MCIQLRCARLHPRSLLQPREVGFTARPMAAPPGKICTRAISVQCGSIPKIPNTSLQVRPMGCHEMDGSRNPLIAAGRGILLRKAWKFPGPGTSWSVLCRQMIIDNLFAILSTGELWLKPLRQGKWEHFFPEITRANSMAAAVKLGVESNLFGTQIFAQAWDSQFGGFRKYSQTRNSSYYPCPIKKAESPNRKTNHERYQIR